MKFPVLLMIFGLAGADTSLAGDNPTVSEFERGVTPSQSRLARGQYLVKGILWCDQCHSEVDEQSPGHPPQTGREGVGRVYSEKNGNRLISPNITPHETTGIGRFTDAQLARAIRQGIGHDGRRLRVMPASNGFRFLSDEDLASVIVYLRSRDAVLNSLPPSIPPGESSAERAAAPLLSVNERNLGDPVALGTYLIDIADCIGCHTPWPAPRMSGVLTGGNSMKSSPGIFSSNLTPHASGIGYGPDAFVTIMKTGKAGTLDAQMPWAAFRNLSEADLRAIYAALATLRPVAHWVSNRTEPSYCEVCGQHHGGGSINKIELPKALVRLDPETQARYVGTYHNRVIGLTVEIRQQGNALEGTARRWTFPLVAQSRTNFLAPGFPSSIRFEGIDSGQASRLVSYDLTELVFTRVAEEK